MEKDIKPVSLEKNYILSMIRTVLIALMPLLVFPYASRILEPEGLGKIDFANSVASYFLMFGVLGIPNYGLREIALVRDNQQERSKFFCEMVSILTISMIFVYGIYFLCIFFIPILKSYLTIFLVIAPSILFYNYSFDWFYKGIENQKYPTLGFVITKVIQIILVFVCIKTRGDYFKYAFIVVTMNYFSSFFIILNLHKYIDFVPLKKLQIKKHIKPIFIIFASTLAKNIYTSIDITMIGIFCTETEVGYYSTANKILVMIICFAYPLVSVMLPILSKLKNEGKEEDYNSLLVTSLNRVLVLIIPIFVWLELLAEPIILFFAGEKFASSIYTLKLLAPAAIIICLAYFVGFQILYTNKKEKYYTVSTAITSLVNIISTFFAIKKWGYNGAVTGTLIAESIGLALQSFFARKYLKELSFSFLNFLKIILSVIIMAIFVFFMNKLHTNGIIMLFAILFSSGLVYITSLLVLQESTAWLYANKLFLWIKEILAKNK